MRTVAEIKASYDAQAGTYMAALSDPAIASLKREVGKKLASVISSHKPASLLDAGVGEATTLVPLLLSMKIRPACVAGFDVSLPRVDIARGYLRDNSLPAMLYQASLEATSVADDSFDVVTTFHAIEPNHGRERDILAELLRITRKALVIVEPSFELAHASARARMDRLGYVRGLPDTLGELGASFTVTPWELNVNPENPAALIVAEKRPA
jgi:ubiquinone/menaquinone biosynthesis C-methylase UbiE